MVDSMRQMIRPARAVSPPRTVAVAIVMPALATALALALDRLGPVGSASVFLLGVVVAAALGGLWAGLGASFLSFASLNFFLTPPEGTFRVAKLDDLVALLVFLVVASVVGALLARALDERARATRREDEARLLNFLATRLLSGESLVRVLQDFAEALLEPFGLARVEIRVEVAGEPVEAVAERFGATIGGPATRVPIVATGVQFGTRVEVIRRIRAFTEKPIIVLSVRERQGDKVGALDAGADDYLTKPFGMEELFARLRATLRRTRDGREPEQPVLRFDGLEVDLARRFVTLDGESVHLTPTEYGLLEVFVTEPGKLLTHQWLLRRVWGVGYGQESHYLRVYVRALRRKLGDSAADPRFITTEPGVGYRWVAEAH